MGILRAIVLAVWAGITSPFRFAFKGLLAFLKGIIATPRAILSLPGTLYKGLKKLRDKILAIVNYLESETGKWIMIWKFVKSPYSLLRACGLNVQTSMAVLGLATVGGTTAVAVEALEPPKFSDAIPGEFYAPNDIPVFTDEKFNTLLITMSSTPLDSLIVKSTSLGTIYGGTLPAGATTAIDIGGTAANRLTIANLTIERLRCKQFKLFETNVNTLTVTDNVADGISFAPSAGSGLSNRPRSVIMGNHGAAKLEQSGGTYDRFVVAVKNGELNASIGELILSDTLTRGGLCRISYADIGNLKLDSNIVGDGTGISTKSMVIEDTTTAQHIVLSQNLEMAIAEPIARTN